MAVGKSFVATFGRPGDRLGVCLGLRWGRLPRLDPDAGSVHGSPRVQIFAVLFETICGKENLGTIGRVTVYTYIFKTKKS